MTSIRSLALGLCLLAVPGCGTGATDLKEGTGPEAKKGDTVVVHYTGWLSDGKKFDSSVDRQEPYQFRLGAGEVIKGWDEGVVGMKVGGKRKLVIPPDKAYGAEGRPPVIPRNAELTFEVELLAIGDLPVQKGEVKITDLKLGSGPEAKTGDRVHVHYTGWLKDGKKFDSSVDRQKALEFQLGAGKVIKGWDEGVVGMKVGGKRKLVIPPDKAYGAQGRPPVIPRNAELTFEVELLAIR